MTHSLKRATRVLVVGSALCVLGALSAPAGAQDCYPDGCTDPTNPPPSPTASCELSVGAGDPGDVVAATVTDVDGAVRLLFAGEQVASADEGGAAVRLEFTVPSASPGAHPVVAVGTTYSVECGVFTVGSGSGVDGEGAGSDDDGSGGVSGVRSGGERSTGGGSLSFTGASTALLVALAAALLLLGSRLVAASKRRRRTAYP